MGLGRRKVSIHDDAAWVFNRMADVYDARPPYPAALIDALVALAGDPATARVGDIGAGVGHLALPLAARGLEVVAVEPAQAMLAQLGRRADDAGLSVMRVHGAAEALALCEGSLSLAVVADAVHFMDAARAGIELGRVLCPGAALALVTVELAPTPYMEQLVTLMEDAAPRRPRDTQRTTAELLARAEVRAVTEQTFEDEAPIALPVLARVLRSISYIGPAMNEARFRAFWERVCALSNEPRWARIIRLRTFRRR